MPHACKLQKWRDVYPWDWKMHNSNLICTEAAARWRIAHCMFMNRNHYRDWGAYRHGPVTQNFFIVYPVHSAALKSSCSEIFSTVPRHFICGHLEQCLISVFNWMLITWSLDLSISRSCHADTWGASFTSSATASLFRSTSQPVPLIRWATSIHVSNTSLSANTNVQQLLRGRSAVCGCVWQGRKCFWPVWEP